MSGSLPVFNVQVLPEFEMKITLFQTGDLWVCRCGMLLEFAIGPTIGEGIWWEFHTGNTHPDTCKGFAWPESDDDEEGM